MTIATPDQTSAPQPDLPRVSVIVVNYNYGRYLRDAVQSVQRQSYRNIECIVVDNASTDDSPAILADLEATIPSLRIIRRAQNGGQSVASAEGFARATGDYVIFLDADDHLLPRAVETHVYAHLCLRVPVGFTSGDILQCVENRVILSTSPQFSDFVRSGRGRIPGAARCIAGLFPSPWQTSRDVPFAMDALHISLPPAIDPWIWSPTSANCFRKDALHLVISQATLHTMVSGTDTYLMHGIGSLTGSALIDVPVAAYRLHGRNIFSHHPSLNRLRAFDDAGAKSNNDSANTRLIDHFIGEAPAITARLHKKTDLIAALTAVNNLWPKLTSDMPGCPTYLASKVVQNYSVLAGLFGRGEVLAWLLRLRASPLLVLRLAAGLRPGRVA